MITEARYICIIDCCVLIFKVNSTDDEDPVEKMIEKTGCMDFHYKVQVKIFSSVVIIDYLLLIYLKSI